MKIEQLSVPQSGGGGKTLLVNGISGALSPGAQHQTLQQDLRARKRGGCAVKIGAIAGKESA